MLFFVLLGCAMILLGWVLLIGGKMFYAIGRLVRMAGGDVEPKKGKNAALYGVILMIAGCGLIYVTMKLLR
jgi:hypothetical protein